MIRCVLFLFQRQNTEIVIKFYKIKDKVNNMSLMEDWEVLANQYNTDQATAQKFWTDYYMQEKAVYEKMLTEPVEVEKGTVAELAEK